MIQSLVKRGPPSTVYVCIYCLGVWSEALAKRGLELTEVNHKIINGQTYVMCAECGKAMRLYVAATPTMEAA